MKVKKYMVIIKYKKETQFMLSGRSAKEAIEKAKRVVDNLSVDGEESMFNKKEQIYKAVKLE